MNKIRRKELSQLIEQLQNIADEIETLKLEEEDYRDNMPENLQSSEKYETAENACTSMEEAIVDLNNVIENIESAIEQ